MLKWPFSAGDNNQLDLNPQRNTKRLLVYAIIGIAAIAVIAVLILSSLHVISISSSPYTVFTETGLPANTNWSVTYDGITKFSTTNSISFSTGSGSYSYNVSSPSSTVTCGLVYLPSESSGKTSAGSKLSISFGELNAGCKTTFNEAGLPAGATWSIDLNGTKNSSSTDTITFKPKLGSYKYNISIIFNSSSKCDVYEPSPQNGTITAGKELTITYTNTTICNNTLTTFNETGLPKGMNWSVTFNKAINFSNSSSLKFFTKPGKYFYVASSIDIPYPKCIGYIPKPSNGTITAGKPILINYTEISTCNSTLTTFNETGLPKGMKWSVTYDGVVNFSNTSHINISTLKGNYSFIISSPYNETAGCKTIYTANPKTGMLEAGTSLNVSYNSTLYCPENFTETGLPTGSDWAVKYDGIINDSYSTLIRFLVPVGSHSYSVPNTLVLLSGCSLTYSPSPGSGTAKTNSTVPISFSLYSEVCPTKFTESSLPSNTNWSVTYDNQLKSSDFSTISFYELNGSYSFSVGSAHSSTSVCNITYNPSPGSGTAKTNSTVSISFSISSETCITTFTETGLPVNTTWKMAYNGLNKSTNSTAISYSDLNGSYAFSVKSVLIVGSLCNTTYTPSPKNGTAVTGSSVSITYGHSTTCKEFTTTFNETGLPKGTNWSVTYNNVTNYSTTQYITFLDLSGNYSYNISTSSSTVPGCTPATYSPSPQNGIVKASSNVSVSYTSPGVVCTTKFTAYNLPKGAFWNVTYNGVTESSTNNTIAFKESTPDLFSYKIPNQLFYSQQGYCGLRSYYLRNISSGQAYGGTNVSVSFLTSSGCTLAYVGNYNSNTVSVINTSNNSLVYTINSSYGPSDAAITPNGKFVYVPNQESDNISIINASSNKIIGYINNLHFPRSIAISPNGTIAYVGGLGATTLPVINLSSNSIITYIKGVSYPFGIAFTPNGKLAYVANENLNTVSVINTSSNLIIDNISGFSSPYGVAITPNGKLAYVTNYGSNTVSVINLSSNSIIETYGVYYPYGVAITPNGKLVYVVSYTQNSVSVFNISSNAKVSTISVGSEPEAISIASNGKLAYVVNSGSVSIINISSNSLITTIGVGSGSIGIGLSTLDSV